LTAYIDADLGRRHLKHDVFYLEAAQGEGEPMFTFSRLPDGTDTWQQGCSAWRIRP
jgi:hypothetical protein